MRLVTIAVSLAVAGPAFAEDDALLTSQRQVAQIVTIAKAVPLLCPAIEADEPAIQALMHDAQITYRDIMDPARFGVEDEAAARSFAQSVRADQRACGEIFFYLGDRERLLRRRIGAPG